MTGVALEACVDSVSSIKAAVEASADRIELCSALEVGGLTPTGSLMRYALRAGIPAHAMIRPRAGDFDYTYDEIDLMIDDIQECRRLGLAGIVIGAGQGGALDETAMARLVTASGSLATTLHRAFDTLTDPHRAIDMAADLGIARILTSGGARSADLGAAQIGEFVDYAGDRVSIMAGGGVGPGNVAGIVRQSRVNRHPWHLQQDIAGKPTRRPEVSVLAAVRD